MFNKNLAPHQRDIIHRTAKFYNSDKITHEDPPNLDENINIWFNSSLKQAHGGLPKVGLVSTSFAFHSSDGWEKTYTLSDKDLDTLIITLRDPVSRFKSAMNMFLEVTQHVDSFDGSLIPFNMISGKQRDFHFKTQKYYIDCLDIPKSVEIKYVYMQGNLIDELNKYFNWNLPVVHEHKSALNLVTDVNEDLIRKWYKDDYDLIESVEFVNR